MPHIKSWREIARPHQDVFEGSFKQAEFAADISQVINGTAPSIYQDASQFFARTFITEGMRLLLISVAQRLAGQGGDPVIQLQTAFGGGKTHTMLAVYHLATRTVTSDKLAGIPPILDAANIQDLPLANIAVLDGINLAVNQGKQHGNITANTLWGELAWQLLKEEGYALLADSDQSGTAPSKETLAHLLSKAAPCVVLIDELQKFFSDLKPDQTLKAGTYEANLKFIQALTEAFKTVPNAILLASLPESDTEVGDSFGQRALVALEKHFGRVESVWKPVATEEAFEIVRRRLFEFAGEPANIKAVCQQFCDYYRQHASHFPLETQSHDYFERMCNSYPIHPEIFDRLYEDWSTLDKFQRTRGVLQYMAVIIHRLWQDNDKDALILPSSLPLWDGTVRTKSIHYLPQGWEPIIEREVDGERSVPSQIDNDHRFGSVYAAHRVMRTIFLGSAPSSRDQVTRGIQLERILLGSVQPEQSIGIFEDVLKRLRDRLHYLYTSQDHYWLDTKPNLRREMESRKEKIDQLTLKAELKKRLTSLLSRNPVFAGIHVFSHSSDVPDDIGSGLRLVVLPPSEGLNRSDLSIASKAAEQILHTRGEQARQRRNRLIFLAPDADVVSRLNDAGRTYLAWRGIVSDIDDSKLNLDTFQQKQAKQNCDGADKTLQHVIRDTYKWLLCPSQPDATAQALQWEKLPINSTAPNFLAEIEQKLLEDEWITKHWSAMHLKSLLQKWYFKAEVCEVNAAKVFQDCCNYLYLPRLINEQVYKDTLIQGLSSEDFFGFAAGKEGDQYLGFCFGISSMVCLDEHSVLIEQAAAKAYQLRTQAPVSTPAPHAVNEANGNIAPPYHTAEGTAGQVEPATLAPAKAHKTQFYGTITLNNPIQARQEFGEIVSEIIMNFTTNPAIKVTVTVDIQAETEQGFDEAIQRAIKENCRTLKFTNAEFEE